MTAKDESLARGFRNAWILTGVAAVFVVLFLAFAIRFNRPAQPERWDMGGTPFVPASSLHADGYRSPPPPAEVRP